MKIYLDDERPAPEGWTLARWPKEAVAFMYSRDNDVTHLSLDHDLGDDSRGTGYDVLLWIESRVPFRQFKIPEITIHTANPAARLRMEAAVDAIHRQRAAMLAVPEFPGVYLKHQFTSAPDCLVKYDVSFAKMTFDIYADFISPTLLIDFLDSYLRHDERFEKTQITGAIKITERFKVRLILNSGTTFKLHAYKPFVTNNDNPAPVLDFHETLRELTA